MPTVTYEVVPHDAGWAYKLGDVFSETFPSRAEAHEAAERVAIEQTEPGENVIVSYQDKDGCWHNEITQGSDRPKTAVAD